MFFTARAALTVGAMLLAQSAHAQAPNTTKPSLLDLLTANCASPRIVIGSATSPICSNVALTNPGSLATLTLGSGKTISLPNSLTISGTDGSTLNVGAGGTLGSNAFTSTAYAPLASPTFTGTVTIPNGGVLGTPTSLTLTNATGLPNAGLLNSTISGVALGGTLGTLTFGTHLTGGGASYNGSAGITITSDATSASTASTLVARDASSNFAAGTITASLTGHASLDLATSALGTNVQTALGNAANAAGGFVTSPVANANLANSSLTLGGTSLALGSTTTLLAGPLAIGTTNSTSDALNVDGGANKGLSVFNAGSVQAGFRWNGSVGGYFFLQDTGAGASVQLQGTGGGFYKPMLTFGSTTVATGNNGEVGFAKISASGSAPGAGYLKISAVAGTNANTCKLIAYAGTSATPVTIVDNVGSGC